MTYNGEEMLNILKQRMMDGAMARLAVHPPGENGVTRYMAEQALRWALEDELNEMVRDVKKTYTANKKTLVDELIATAESQGMEYKE